MKISLFAISWQVSKNLLLIFVCASLGAQVWKTMNPVPESESLPDGISVVVCHAAVRCPTCRAMEAGTRACLERNFPDRRIPLLVLNYEAPENADFERRWNVATATVLLLRREKGVETFQNLAAEAWQHVGNEADFQAMLREKLAQFIVSSISTTTSEPVPDASPAIPLRLSEDVPWE